MPSDRTTVTELGTGLGMLGLERIDEAMRSRTPVMHSLSPEMWERLGRLRAGGAYDAEFHAAWANGQAFLRADDGLRGRLPLVVEWKGTGRAPGDEVAPIDLRVDHVYLVSCKYLSKILFNVSPASIFDSLLFGGPGRGTRPTRDARPGGGDWYAEVAPARVPGALRVRSASPPVEAAEASSALAVLTPTRSRGADTGRRCPPRSALPGLSDGRRRSVPRRADADARRRAPAPPGLARAAGRAPSTSPCRSARRWATGSARAGRRAPRSSTPRCRARWPGRPPAAGRRPWTSAAGRARPCCGASCASGSAPYFVLGSSADALPPAAHRDLVGLAPAVPADRHRPWRASGAASPGWAGRPSCATGPPTSVPTRGRAHRGALEPRPFRRAARGQGLPRHAAPPRSGVLHAAMSAFDPAAFTPPLRVPQSRLAAGRAPSLRPSPTWPWCARPRPIRSSPPSRRCRGRTRTTRAGPSLSASTHATPRATATRSSSPTEAAPTVGHRVDRAVAAGDRERARLHRLLARRPRPRAAASPPTPCGAWSRSPSARSPSRACISSSSPGTSRRPARPQRPGSSARRRCGVGAHRRRAARRRLLRLAPTRESRTLQADARRTGPSAARSRSRGLVPGQPEGRS